MLLAEVATIFLVLILLSMPIVFALAVAGIAGLWIGGYPMQQLSSALVSGSQSWVLANPALFTGPPGLRVTPTQERDKRPGAGLRSCAWIDQ